MRSRSPVIVAPRVVRLSGGAADYRLLPLPVLVRPTTTALIRKIKATSNPTGVRSGTGSSPGGGVVEVDGRPCPPDVLLPSEGVAVGPDEGVAVGAGVGVGAAAITSVSSVALLLVGSGSPTGLVTLAVSVWMPPGVAAGTLNATVTVAEPPAAIVPRPQLKSGPAPTGEQLADSA